MVKWNKLLLITASMGLLAACDNGATEEDTGADTEETAESDATTGATQSVVSDEETLLEGLSEEGGWIVIFEGDIESDEELVMAGGKTNNDGEAERKLALYTQDADRNVTDTFTLTAPSITIQNESTRLQNGTFAGDVYVEAENFRLIGGTIDGDLIFRSEELQESAELEEGEVTGEIRVEEE